MNTSHKSISIKLRRTFAGGKVLPLLLLCISAALPATAQEKSTENYAAFGNVVDQVTKKSIEDARVIRCRMDSTVVDTSWTSKDHNAMDIRNVYFFKLQKEGGNYLFRVDAEGYEPLWILQRIPAFTGRRFVYRIPTISLKRKAPDKQLATATVSATKIKFYTRGDTVVYNADAFNLSEGSMLDALIKQLPGAELRSGGEIFVNGEKVESLYLNGNDFFKGDNQLILDNLPAYTVKDIQIYHKGDERSEMMGVQIGKKELAMNVRLKREYNTHWITNVEAGGGTKERFLARLFSMRFTDHSNLSLIANVNNVNDTRDPGQNDSWSPENMPDGLITHRTVAANYEVEDAQNRYELEGSAQVNHNDSRYETQTAGENFLPEGNTYLRERAKSQDHYTQFKGNHYWKAGESVMTGKVALQWEYNLEHQRKQGENVAATFAESPSALGAALMDSLEQPQAGSWLRRTALNRQLGQLRNNSDQYLLQLRPLFTINVVQNDIFYVNGNVKFNGEKRDNYSNRLYDYPMSQVLPADFRRQWDQLRQHRQHYEIKSGYAFVFPGNFIVDPYYTITHERQHSNNPLYRLDQLDGWGATSTHDIGETPSEMEYLRQALDQQNSFWRHNRLTEHTSGIEFNWNSMGTNNGSWWGVNVEMPVRFVSETMDYRKAAYDGSKTRHYTAFEPTLWVQHGWKEWAYQWNFYYEMAHTASDMANLLPLESNSDPLNIYHGNPGQKNTVNHRWHFNFYHDNKEKQESHDLRVRFDLLQNATVMGYTYDRTTGIRHYHPDNVNGNYKLTASYNYSIPLDKAKRLTLNTHTYTRYEQGVDLIGQTRSTVHTTDLMEKLKIDYKIGKNTIGALGYVNWEGARSKRADFDNVDTWRFRYGLTGTMQLPWKMALSTDLTMFSRRGFDGSGNNTNDLVWNARLTKELPKQHLTFLLDGFDILHQLSSVTLNMNSQGRTETYRNVLPRFFMAHVIYKLNIKPKKERNE